MAKKKVVVEPPKPSPSPWAALVIVLIIIGFIWLCKTILEYCINRESDTLLALVALVLIAGSGILSYKLIRKLLNP